MKPTALHVVAWIVLPAIFSSFAEFEYSHTPPGVSVSWLGIAYWVTLAAGACCVVAAHRGHRKARIIFRLAIF
jgi:hypothetical protein